MPIAKISGLTLIELLIVIVVAAILLVWGVPSFRSIIQNNRSLAFSSAFTRSINLAKNEAIKRSSAVSICAANASLTGCSTSSWANGWLVFSDTNGDGAYDSSTDALLAISQAFSGQETVTAPASVITFNGSGFLTAGSGNYQISATGCSGNNARTILISTTGRITIQNTNCP